MMSKKLIKNRQFNVGIVESYKANSKDSGHGVDSPILGSFNVRGMTVENMVSQNRTKYSKEVWSQPTAFGQGGKFIDESGKLKPATLFGSVDHPTDDRAELLLNEAAIAWYDVKRNDDGSWDGQADILNNPQGKIVKTFLDYAKVRGGGDLLGVSSRALGESRLEESSDGQYEAIVPESFELMSFDFVYNPSFQTAVASLNESTKGPKRSLLESVKALAEEDKEHAEVYNKVAEELEKENTPKETKKESNAVVQAKKDYYKTLRKRERELYNALLDFEEMYEDVSDDDFKKDNNGVSKGTVEQNMREEYEEVLAEIAKLKETKVENKTESEKGEEMKKEKIVEAKMYKIDLAKDKAKKLAQALKDAEIYYEPSSNGDLVHFEIKCDEKQKEAIEKFLKTIKESVDIIKESQHVFNEENKTIGDFIDSAKESEKDIFGDDDNEEDELDEEGTDEEDLDNEEDSEDSDLEELDLDLEEEEEEPVEGSVEEELAELKELVQKLVDFLMPLEDSEGEFEDLEDLEDEDSLEELEDSDEEDEELEDSDEDLSLDELTEEDLDELTDEELEYLANLED